LKEISIVKALILAHKMFVILLPTDADDEYVLQACWALVYDKHEQLENMAPIQSDRRLKWLFFKN
jgi:hypothetical protein